jgi:hypothetical protein
MRVIIYKEKIAQDNYIYIYIYIYIHIYICMYSFFLCVWYWYWNSVPSLLRQVPYHLSHTRRFFALVIFLNKVLCFCQPWDWSWTTYLDHLSLSWDHHHANLVCWDGILLTFLPMLALKLPHPNLSSEDLGL